MNCGQLADKLRDLACDSVISPALGGIIVGQEIGRSLGKRHIFAEKEGGGLVLRRGLVISPNERFIVAEDVVTRGGRVQETIDIVRQHGGIVTASARSSIAVGADARTSAVPSSA
jgi:orotate phosphoribosyltransferase